MIRVKSKHKLKQAPVNEFVYVETIGKFYWNDGSGWIEKVYFSLKEASEIIGVDRQYIIRIMNRFRMRPERKMTAITSSQLRMLSKAVVLRKQKMNYSDIKKQIL